VALEREIATYQANLPGLLAHEGQFVVIRGDRVAGVWQTYEDALKAAYAEFGLETFLVKQIHAIEPVLYFTHDLPDAVPDTPAGQ
jgi:hypothetical protein